MRLFFPNVPCPLKRAPTTRTPLPAGGLMVMPARYRQEIMDEFGKPPPRLR
jgi:hypothetical protein